LHKTDLCRIKFLRHQGLAPTAYSVYYCVKELSRIFFQILDAGRESSPAAMCSSFIVRRQSVTSLAAIP
ncbi:hypothetical protein, partial [Megasphaera elsdenii]|uniref:hypothetical protein n=1 Tax=Megasphaera elsdenii TaxID=907 RepID=UPI0022E265CB